MTEAEMKQCPNCEKAIEASKFMIHELRCMRQMFKCRECGEVVERALKEEHDKNAHSSKVCQYCKYEAPAVAFGEHEKTCDMRPRTCQWCEEIVTMDLWAEHTEMCGAKT